MMRYGIISMRWASASCGSVSGSGDLFIQLCSTWQDFNWHSVTCCFTFIGTLVLHWNTDGIELCMKISSSSSRRQICKAHLHTKVSQTRLLPYAHSNSQLLRLRLNCSRVFALRMFEARPFQVKGPAMWKLRLPKRVVRSADRSRDRAATVCTHHACTSDIGRGDSRMWCGAFLLLLSELCYFMLRWCVVKQVNIAFSWRIHSWLTVCLHEVAERRGSCETQWWPLAIWSSGELCYQLHIS